MDYRKDDKIHRVSQTKLPVNRIKQSKKIDNHQQMTQLESYGEGLSSSSKHLLMLQQTRGNRYVSRLIQAEIGKVIRREDDGDETGIEDSQSLSEEQVTGWITTSTIKTKIYTNHPRSEKLKEIDSVMSTYNSDKMLKGSIERQILNLTNIKNAIIEWKNDTHKKDKRRIAIIKRLESWVDNKLVYEQERKRAKELRLEQAKILYGRIEKLSHGMGQFASRDGTFANIDSILNNDKYDVSDPIKGIQTENMESVETALSLPRAEDGSLSPEAVTMMDNVDTATLWDKALEKATGGKLEIAKGVTTEQLQEIANKNKNTVTNKTSFPELTNAITPSIEEDKPLTETFTVGGVAMTITYNKSDVNFQARFEMFKAAIEKVQSAGYTVPSFTVNMPKFGRQISVTADCEIKASGAVERAMFVAPNQIVLSSEGINNPIDSKTGGDEYAFSSTGFDPSGVATIVHEIGHALHRHQNGGRYHELSFTALKSIKGDDNMTVINFEKVVSKYGSQKPRELVAEVFLGLVYGKKYPGQLMEAYNAFGGPTQG